MSSINRYTVSKKLIESIAKEVRRDASNPRIRRSIQLILESFSPEHIITELLQNADDVTATHAEIELTDDGVYFTHNGEVFNEKHLRALCDIGQTTKKPGVHIGFMGIGFKSAFKISDFPHIFSGPYHFYFKRDDVFVPYWKAYEELTESTKERVKQDLTTIFLPFRQDLPFEIREILKETILVKLEPLCLAFLKNLETIKIVVKGITRVLSRKKEILSKGTLIKEKVIISERKNKEERTYQYLIFRKSLEISEIAKADYRARDSGRAKLKTTDITLAFCIRNNSLVPIRSVLYTFLPTPFEPGLRFVINCDFLLNTQRSDIDFSSKWNLWLLEGIGELLKEVVNEFLKENALRLSYFDILPRRNETDKRLYEKIAKPLIEYMEENRCIPTSEMNLAKPSEVVLASEDVIKIIPPEKAGVKYYVDPRIEGKAFLRDELRIKDLTHEQKEIEYVLNVLMDEKWLKSLSIDRVCNIYVFLYQKIYEDVEKSWKLSYWDKNRIEKQLKEFKIIRTVDGEYCKADETFLPGELGHYLNKLINLPCLMFVDSNILSDKSRKLLRNLGIRECSPNSVIDKILETQSSGEWKNWTEEQRTAAISYVADYLREKNYQVEENQKSKLGNLILPTEKGWAPAHYCYIPNPKLRRTLPNANFVNLERIKNFVCDVDPFLRSIGVLPFPRVVQEKQKDRWNPPKEISRKKWEAYWEWLYGQKCNEYSTGATTVTPAYLDGFDECVESQDITRLAGYLSFLMDHWNDYYKSFTQVRYYWFYYYRKSKYVPSYFTYQLQTYKWLPTSQGLMKATRVFAPLRKIKKIGRNLFPYLKISEEKAIKCKEFLSFLGIKIDVDLEALLLILDKVKNVEVTDILKSQLSLVYRKLARVCEDEKIDKDVMILDTKGNFHPSRDLIWIDYPEFEQVLANELPIAWVPENLSRPDIQTLFNALGVRRISQLMERRIVNINKPNEDPNLTKILKQKREFLYSILLHNKAGKADLFPDFIKEMVVIRTENFEMEIKILNKVYHIKTPCFCDLQKRRVYVSSQGGFMDITREMVRVFEAPPGTEFVMHFALKENAKIISDHFRKSSIKLISLPEYEIEEEPTIPTKVIESVTDEFSEETKAIIESRPMTQTIEEIPEVSVKVDKDEITKEIIETKQLLMSGKTESPRIPDVWREPKEIEKVVSKPRIIVRPFVSASSGKNWHPQIIDGEKIFVEVGLDSTKIESAKSSIKNFRELIRKIVQVMGGNPGTVNICIANPETDGDRREGQLFFNVLRKDKPFRWIVVVARELAYLKFPKPSPAHINLMTDLIEKAIENIDKIFPEIYRRTR